jgi:hypothetical protein
MTLGAVSVRNGSRLILFSNQFLGAKFRCVALGVFPLVCLDSSNDRRIVNKTWNWQAMDSEICRSAFYNHMLPFIQRNTLHVHACMCHDVHVRVTQPYTLTQGHACGRE